jgi:predicted dehydrogenase
VEDFGILAMTLENGIVATISAGRIGYTSHPSSGPMKIHLVGTKSLMTFNAYNPRVEVYTSETPWTPPKLNPDDPMGFWNSTSKNAKPKRSWIPISPGQRHTNDVSYFIDCIESNHKSEVSAKEGAAQVEVLMAGYLSAATGSVVSLPIPRL